MRNKTLFLFLPFLLVLVGCGAKTSPKSAISITYSAPTGCAKTSILAALPKDIPNPVLINTPWQPAPGTELADVLNNGGIACSFGNQSAEIGATIFWVNDNGLFDKRVAGWTTSGYEKVDIPNLDESAAYLLFKPVSATQEFHIWSLNFLFHGVWIEVSGTFINDLATAAPVITAAVASLSKNTVTK